MRQLKHHEQKLLKKVNFLQWKSDQNVREIKVLRRYHVQVPRPLLSPAIEPPCPPHPTPLSGCWSYLLVFLTCAHVPNTPHMHNPPSTQRKKMLRRSTLLARPISLWRGESLTIVDNYVTPPPHETPTPCLGDAVGNDEKTGLEY